MDFYFQQNHSKRDSVLAVVFISFEENLVQTLGCRAILFNSYPIPTYHEHFSSHPWFFPSYGLSCLLQLPPPACSLSLLLSFALSSFPLPLAANQLCPSQQSSCRWLGEPGSLVLDGPGTRQRLWSPGSSIDQTTKPWWKKVSSKKFTLRPTVKENGDIVTAAGFFPLSSLSKTCPLQRDGMRFSTIWECSVTQYYLHFPPCFMLLSDPCALPSSQRSMTLRWLANFPIILTVNGRTIERVILYFASLSLTVLSPLIPRYQTQKPK